MAVDTWKAVVEFAIGRGAAVVRLMPDTADHADRSMSDWIRAQNDIQDFRNAPVS
jgi:hypothetical protein